MDETDANGCAVWSGCLVCLTATWGLVKMMACCRCRSLISSECSEVESDPRTRPRTSRIVRIRFRSKENGTIVMRDLTEPQLVLSRGWIEGIVEEMERAERADTLRSLTERARVL